MGRQAQQLHNSVEQQEPQGDSVRPVQQQHLYRPTERPPLPPPQSNYQDSDSQKNTQNPTPHQIEPENYASQQVDETIDEASFKPRQMGRRSRNFRKSITSGSLASEASMSHQTSLNRQASFTS